MKTKTASLSQAASAFLVACVSFFLACGLAAAQSAPEGGGGKEVLSVGWQSGYCAARPKSRGCTDFSATSAAAQRFSLNSRFLIRRSYCGIEDGVRQQARKGKWTDLPEITLASGTRERLLAAMPAARVGMDRQQWLRSGSCVTTSAEAYYSRSLDLLDQFNASPVPSLFAGKAGGAITLAEVRAAFDKAFGPGAGERVRLTCRKAADRTVVIGLTIGLAAGEGPLSQLIGGASPTKSRCTEGFTGAGKAG